MLLADWKWASAIKQKQNLFSSGSSTSTSLLPQLLCLQSVLGTLRDTDKYIHPDNDTLMIEKSGLSEFANKHKANTSSITEGVLLTCRNILLTFFDILLFFLLYTIVIQRILYRNLIKQTALVKWTQSWN